MRNKISIFLFMFISTLLHSEDVISQVGSKMNEEMTQSGLSMFLEKYDWEGGIWEELEFDFTEWKSCDSADLKKALFGPTTYLSEPLYLTEANTASNQIKTLDMEIGSWRPDKSGQSMENGGMYVNVFKFPIMDMLIGNSSKGMLVFEKGYPQIVYLGRIDPKKWWNIMSFQMDPLKALFSNFYGAAAGAGSCLANTTLDSMPISMQHNNQAAKGLRYVIDSLYYSAGCKGSIPFGTDTTASGPITTGILTTTSVMYDIHMHNGITADLFSSHTVRSTLNGYSENILCKPMNIPNMPLTMYTTQRLYPLTGKTQPIGVSPIKETHANYNGGADKTTFFVFNKRREYIAGAYQE